MDWKSPEFIALQKKWYQKLKKSGFKEIENTDHPEPFLIQWDSTRFFKDYSAEQIEEHQTYYRMCDDFYWNYQAWKSPPEKEIWHLHSQGYSRRKISHLLWREHKIKISDSSVQIILSRLKLIMHTQTWPRSSDDEVVKIGHSEGIQSDCQRYQRTTHPSQDL